VPMTS